MENLKNLGIKLSHDSAIPLLAIYPEKTIIQKSACTSVFIAELFTIASTWKQPRCPLADEWIRKLWYIYTMDYYSTIKRNSYLKGTHVPQYSLQHCLQWKQPRTWKQPRCPSADEWIRKLWYTMEYHSAKKKERI